MAGEIRSKAIVQTAEEGLASGRVGLRRHMGTDLKYNLITLSNCLAMDN